MGPKGLLRLRSAVVCRAEERRRFCEWPLRVATTTGSSFAIAVGRFGLQNSDEVAPYVSDLLRHWCITMRNIRDNEEKESSFRGLCNVIMANPTAALNDLVFFCDAISSWSTLKPELRELFVKILFAFKQEVGDAAWQEFTSGFPPLLRQRLGQLYGL